MKPWKESRTKITFLLSQLLLELINARPKYAKVLQSFICLLQIGYKITLQKLFPSRVLCSAALPGPIFTHMQLRLTVFLEL